MLKKLFFSLITLGMLLVLSHGPSIYANDINPATPTTKELPFEH